MREFRLESKRVFDVQILPKIFSVFFRVKSNQKHVYNLFIWLKLSVVGQRKNGTFCLLQPRNFPIPSILGVTYISKDLISWDSRVFKTFLWTLNPSCGYSEHSSDSDLSKAPTLVSVQRLETILKAKKKFESLYNKKIQIIS